MPDRAGDAMPRAMKPCSAPGCPELVPSGGREGRCPTHAGEARRRHYAKRDQRGGGSTKRWRNARALVLRRDPWCTCTDTRCDHGQRCYSSSTVADHWPRSKRELIDAGEPNPDAAEHMRGLCKPCHDRSTARLYPSGWAAPR